MVIHVDTVTVYMIKWSPDGQFNNGMYWEWTMRARTRSDIHILVLDMMENEGIGDLFHYLVLAAHSSS